MQNSNGYTYIFEYTEPNWFRFFLYFILFINTHVDECRMYHLFVWVVHILESALLCHKNATLKSDCAHIYVHKELLYCNKEAKYIIHSTMRFVYIARQFVLMTRS